MRAYLPDYHVTAARSLVDALAQLAANATETDARKRLQPLAGGTDLMVLLAAGKLPGGRYLSLWDCAELRGITVEPDAVWIGALATYTDIRRHPLLKDEFPSLVQAAAESGALAIQNRGTIGGNIANASPAADTPPALLVYDATLELTSVRGPRLVPYAGFHSGYKQTHLGPDELITRVRLPRRAAGSPPLVHFYRKVGTRKAQAISKVCVAATAVPASGGLSHMRLALGSVAPIPLRCPQTEAVLTGRPLTPALVAEAQAVLGREITPIDDVRSTAAYRLKVAQNVLGQLGEVLRGGAPR